MQKEEFIDIADKVSEGLATDQEKQLFLFHLRTFATQNPEWEKLAPELRQQIEDEIKSDIRLQVFGEDQRKSKTIKLWPRIVAIAAAVALLVLGVYFFNYRNDKHTNSNTLATQDITPGTVGATLTLANGKKIKLSDAANGELASQSGVTISKSANGQLTYEIKENTNHEAQLNTLSTANGETYRVRLPDGSLVWLNATSSLTFSSNLNEGGRRRVKLIGEGYFEVTKDKDHPFIVESSDQEVEVLGTHFNINAYQDEDIIKTTLIEGSVKIITPKLQKMLLPGHEAVKSGNDIQVYSVKAEQAAAWKDGRFVFDNKKIGDIMKMIERWYNVQVIYEGEMPEDLFLGSVSRFDHVSQVLNILESTGRVHFKVEDRKIYVSR